MAIDKVKLPDNSVEEVRDSRIPGIDSAPTANSTNLVTSGGVKSALDGYLPLTGGTMTGGINFSSNVLLQFNNDNVIVKYSGDTCLSGTSHIYLDTPALYTTNGGAVYAIWHQGNDGYGSGLDADLLDGREGSDYVWREKHGYYDGTIPSVLGTGFHEIVVQDVEYSSILAGRDYDGKEWQLYFHPHEAYSDEVYYLKPSKNLKRQFAFTDSNNLTNYLFSEQVYVPQDTTYGSSNVSWAEQYAEDKKKAFVYNDYGIEYSYLFGLNSNGTYGAILKMGYADSYLRILRKENTWKTSDWEKISAGKADQLSTARTIWGQDFDGTGNVDGLLTANLQAGASGTAIQINDSISQGYSAIRFAVNNAYEATIQYLKNVNDNPLGQHVLSLDPVTGGDTTPSSAFVSLGLWTNPALWVDCTNYRVGVGTTSPATKLDVNGGGAFKGSIYANYYNGHNNQAGGAIVINKGGDYFGVGPAPSNISDLAFGLTSDAEGTWKSVFGGIANNGNVGIGTSVPGALFHVHGPSGEVVRISQVSNYTAGSGPELSFYNSGSEKLASVRGVFDRSNSGQYGNLLLGTRSSDAAGVTTKVTILHNGRVGIMTVTPDHELDVAGVIRGTSVTTTLQTSQPSDGMLPNRQYALGELSGDTTFSMAAGASGNTNHYYWTFSTPSTAPTITWPAAITSWYGGSAPTINASKHYEVSVLDGVAICMEV